MHAHCICAFHNLFIANHYHLYNTNKIKHMHLFIYIYIRILNTYRERAREILYACIYINIYMSMLLQYINEHDFYFFSKSLFKSILFLIVGGKKSES